MVYGIVSAIDEEVLAVVQIGVPSVAHLRPYSSWFARLPPAHAIFQPDTGHVVYRASVLGEAISRVFVEVALGLQLLSDLDACPRKRVRQFTIPRGLGARARDVAHS